MITVVFYEKPGCVTNARQKMLLRAAGLYVTERDLLREPWTLTRLRRFFGERPVREWFNPVAPRVQSGEVLPHRLSAEEALLLMVEDPLLIRRPLIEVGGQRFAGFDPAVLGESLGGE
ncbi:MAG: ArsC/Spx/MgsR family protein, partial [Halothiobacillaceae bacterium]|nr:ArsC/Spx/MgsR family protein [Halothiobacillaceae bacterium]